MKIRRFGITATAATTAAGVLLTSGAAHAQQAAGSIASLDEVVVTATKREEKLHDVAMSITAVDGDDLTRRHESSYLDFAAQVPGLSFEAIDAGTNRVILRGQNVGSVGATVATTVDDIPFFMSGAQADGSFFSANIDTYDLKRVEVLRGPQGTLYGAAAEGGLIKYVTNLPELGKFQAQINLGGQVVHDGQADDSAKGLVNLPFWGDKAAIRISAVEENLPGWVDNQLQGQTGVNHGRKYSLRGSVLVKPTDQLTIRLTAFNQGLTVQGDNAVEVVGAAANPAAPPANQFAPVNGLNHNFQAPHTINDRLFYYALSLEYALPLATLTSNTSYGQISERFTSDLSDNNLAPGLTYGDFLGAIVYGGPIIVAGRQLEFVHKFNQELRVTSNPGSSLFGNPLDWQGGVFFTRETSLLDQPYDARRSTDFNTLLAPPLGGAGISAYYKEMAIFADATYHFSKAFDVEIGGRSTHTKQESQTTFFCCVLYGPDFTYAPIYQSESSRTWSVAPRWHITDDSLLYARYATGFRPGGPNIPTPTLPDPPSFLSDSTRNIEVGFRTNLFGRRLSIDLATFYILWKDVQILGIVQTPTGPVGINGNSGSAKNYGLEWNFQLRPVEGLSLGLLGAYTNAKLSADALGLGAKSGDQLPFVPDVSNTLNVDYTWNGSGGYAGNVGASWTYTGVRYTGFSPSVATTEPHVKLPTYNTLRVQVGLDNGKYSAEVYADNLTNSRGITSYSNSGGHAQTGLAVFIQPRTVGVQLGAKF